MTVFGHAVFLDCLKKKGRHCVYEDSREAWPQTKVAIIAPRDEHRSKTK